MNVVCDIHFNLYSFLKSLVPKFNSLVDDSLEKLKPLADGKTIVPLSNHIRDFVLNVVSEVSPRTLSN